MREENNRPAGGTDEAVEDVIVEKNIKTKTAVHTGAKGETRHIPTDAEDADRALDVNVGSSRFIKTGTTPFLSVRAEQSEQETVTEISARFIANTASYAFHSDEIRSMCERLGEIL